MPGDTCGCAPIGDCDGEFELAENCSVTRELMAVLVDAVNKDVTPFELLRAVAIPLDLHEPHEGDSVEQRVHRMMRAAASDGRLEQLCDALMRRIAALGDDVEALRSRAACGFLRCAGATDVLEHVRCGRGDEWLAFDSRVTAAHPPSILVYLGDEAEDVQRFIIRIWQHPPRRASVCYVAKRGPVHEFADLYPRLKETLRTKLREHRPDLAEKATSVGDLLRISKAAPLVVVHEKIDPGTLRKSDFEAVSEYLVKLARESQTLVASGKARGTWYPLFVYALQWKTSAGEGAARRLLGDVREKLDAVERERVVVLEYPLSRVTREHARTLLQNLSRDDLVRSLNEWLVSDESSRGVYDSVAQALDELSPG